MNERETVRKREMEKAGKSPTAQGWLNVDRRTIPDGWRKSEEVDMGTADVPVSRYISRDFHDLEMAHMWPHVWQMACHLDEIPEKGDFVVYDIGDHSFIVVRTSETEIRAFRNACLHRGMMLKQGKGKSGHLTCPFHGWSWKLDGSVRNIPEKWDFPQVAGAANCLPQAKVATWGNFVFLNMDPDAESFASYSGALTEHFARAPLEDRRVAVHFATRLPANWKIAQEAFIESYHVSPTHPEVVPISEYAETQYDLYPDDPNISRMITISLAPVAAAVRALSPQQFADRVGKTTGREPLQVPEGLTFREAMADQRRAQFKAESGIDVSHLTDVETLDGIEYFLFPNFLPWYGFGVPIVYRFRPDGDRHDHCIMEVYVMAARDGAREQQVFPATLWREEHQKFGDFPALGRLGPVFDQDHVNIVGVQKGLRATTRTGVQLARYQESRIRHYHARITHYIDRYRTE